MFIVPASAILEAWDKGDAITDDQLSALKQFFSAMVRGCEALGQRYSLATMALRAEYDRADRIERYRQMN